MSRLLIASLLVVSACSSSSENKAPDANRDLGGDTVTPPDTKTKDRSIDADSTTTDGPVERLEQIVCPGDPSCKPGSQTELLAAAAKRGINPTGCESYEDLNGDNTYSSNEPFDDANGNGKFDVCWFAGNSVGQPIRGVADDLWARALVLRQDDTTLALVSVDLLGLFYDEVKALQEALDPKLGIDLLLVSSTHNHNAPDTLGMWGPNVMTSGIDDVYQQRVRDAITAVVTEAVSKLEPVKVVYGQTETVDESGSTRPYVGDGRDPVIIDPTLTAIQFVALDDKATVATFVNWSSHPESWGGGGKRKSTSDFPHWLREGIEKGTRGHDGLGGIALFFNGSVGGQIGPKDVEPLDSNGAKVTEGGEPFARAVGESVAALTLKMLAESTDEQDAPKLRFAAAPAKARVENRLYHFVYRTGVMKRAMFDYDEDVMVSELNIPSVLTLMASIHLGKVHMVTVPGELHPELAVGYDKKWSYGQNQVSPDNPAPPALSKAPPPPYLKGRMSGEYNLILGLTPDMLGYIMPRYNFILSSFPYVAEAEGDHYEETNSIGPGAAEELLGVLEQLLAKGH